MRYLLLATLLLTGCAEVYWRPGISVKDKVTKAGKYGPVEKMEEVISINGDVPGLQEVPTRLGPIRIAQVSGQNSRLIIDAKTGTVLGTETTTTLGGLFVTDHVKARGVADQFRIKEVSAGVSGAIVSGAAMGVVGPGLGAIPK